MVQYCIQKTDTPPPAGEINSSVWRQAAVAQIDYFYPHSSDHRPRVNARLLWGEAGLYILFEVKKDCYVLCENNKPQSSVCNDSCVEAFLKPSEDSGYFNFEFNCGGTPLVYYIEDWRITENGFAKRTILSDEDLELISIDHSLPKTIIPEIIQPTDWWLQAFVPWVLFEKYAGAVAPKLQDQWRGNFYKCADHSSHPHWASWSPVKGEFTFHSPDYFGEIYFG